MANPRKRSPDRQSWKQGSKQQQQTPTAAKWLVTLLFLGFLGLFIWYWWPTPNVRVQFLALEVSDYSKLVAPQLPSDTSVLDTDDDYVRFLDYSNESAGLDAGQSGLLNIAEVSTSDDRLVVYLSAHLVPIGDGEIGILPRNYELTESSPMGSGHYELGDLLAKMKSSPAKAKLLLIDSGRLTIDPRLSLLGNQAYELLKSKVADLDDSSIGVIVSNGPLESATGWYGRPQTFFGEAVTDAFLGAADKDSDEWLTVGELFEYVAGECFAYSGENQSPVLLAQADFRDTKLFPFDSRKKNKESEDTDNDDADGEANASETDVEKESSSDAESTENGTTSQNRDKNESASTPNGQDASSGKASETSSDSAQSTSQDGDGANNTDQSKAGSDESLEPNGQPKPNRATPGYLRTVDRAWQLHDVILQRHALAVKAPHLARELAARVLDYELRFHGSTPSNNNGLMQFVNSLEQISSGDLSDVPGELGGRIATALNAFAKTEDTEARAIRDAQQIAYETGDYLDWHAKVAFLQNTDNFEGLLRTLVTRINTFRKELPNETTELARERELRLNESVKNIRSARKTVEAEWLRLIEDAASKQVRDTANQCLVEATLGTRLPTARQRTRWRSLLLAAREVELLSKPPFRESDKSTEILPSNLQAHLELQSLFLGTDAPTDQNTTTWSGLRSLAGSLSEYYSALPSKISADGNSQDAWRLVAIDYRDAARVTVKSSNRLQAAFSPRAVFAWSIRPDSKDLGAKGISVPWAITNTTGQAAEVSVAFNPEEVILYAGPDNSAKRIEPNATVSIPGSARVNWFAEPADPKRKKSVQIPVKFSVRSRSSRLSDTTITLTQVVNDVGIQVYNITGNNNDQRQTQSVLQLKPYPNRPSRFRFELTNASKEPKTVSVRIAAIPPSQITPGLLSVRNSTVMEQIQRRVIRNGKIASEINVVAESKAPITVPPNGTVPLMLATPAPPKPEDPNAPPPRRPNLTPTDISYGLVCEITEQVADELEVPTRWLRWLEIRPAKPNTYLTCEADYIPKTGTKFGEFTATIQPQESEMPDVSQRPIKVAWDTSFLSVDPEGLRRGMIKSANGAVTIRGKVQPPATVWIDADNYPRAFSYKISRANGIEEGHKPMARITSLTNAKFARGYARRTVMREKLPELTEGQHNPRPTFERGDLVPFPRPKSPFLMRFLVDAESKDFGADDADSRNRDFVRLDLGGEQEIETFYDDRQVEMTLSGIDDDTIEVKCAVTDYEIEFDDPGISAPQRLELSMVIDGQKADTDNVEMSIDQTKPFVNLSLEPSRVYPGKFFQAKVSASDAESDIYKITVGYVQDKNDPIKRSERRRMKAPDEVGRYWVRAEVLNGALVTGFATANLSVVAKPKPVVPAPPPPPKYKVTGIAMIGTRSKGGIKVELKGKKPVITKSDGVFTFTDVPGGQHTITATGRISLGSYAAEHSFQLPEEGPSRTERIDTVIKLKKTK